jgi:hypothetical protein
MDMNWSSNNIFSLHMGAPRERMHLKSPPSKKKYKIISTRGVP